MVRTGFKLGSSAGTLVHVPIVIVLELEAK